MSKTIKIEIEIPAPPEGWGEVEYRRIEQTENVLFWDSRHWMLCPGRTDWAYPVARKLAPQWTPPPEWHAMFGDSWVSRDKFGNVRVHRAKPSIFHEHGVWESDEEEFYMLPFRIELMPPNSIPWEKCCFKIGEPKE